MIKKDERRSHYFIKKSFQTKFILKFCGLVALGAVLTGAILFLHLFFRGTVTTAFVNSRLSIVTTADYILPVLISASLVTVILISIATAATVLYLSHRIAGPLFNVERSIRQIGAGDLNVKVRLRATDEIAKMAECLNEATENFKVRISDLKAQSRNLDEQISGLKAQGEKKDLSVQQIKDALEKLSRAKEVIDEKLDYFKV